GWLWHPLTVRDSLQNVDARRSALSRVDVTMAGEITLMGLNDDIVDEELVLYDERVPVELSPAILTGVIPTRGLGGFGIPPRAQGDTVPAKLKELLKPENLFLLGFQQGIADGDLQYTDYADVLTERDSEKPTPRVKLIQE